MAGFDPFTEGPAAPQPASGGPDDDWEGTTALAAPEVHESLGELSGRGAPVPEVGCERTGTGAGCGRHRQDGGRHAPRAVARAATVGEHGLAHVALEAGAVDSAEKEGVRLATMHRVKGLEFDRVVMASVNDLVPLPAAIDARGDAVERESAETEERALVYVAATRAKKELLVLSFGTPSRLL